MPDVTLVLLAADAAAETGSLWPVVVGVVSAGLLALLGALTVFFARKASESKAWAAYNRAWLVVQAVAAHVESVERPAVQAALADGTLTPAEVSQLKAIALREARVALADQLGPLAKALKLADGALDVFLSGLIEKALTLIRGEVLPAAPAPPATPLPTPSLPTALTAAPSPGSSPGPR